MADGAGAELPLHLRLDVDVEHTSELVRLRRLLVRLSGRLMKRGVEYTAPALFAGMWNLLAIIDALDEYSVDELQQMAGVINRILGLPENNS